MDQEVDMMGNLSPENHARRVVRVVNRCLGYCRDCTEEQRQRDMLKQIIMTFLRPEMMYGLPTWSP